MVSIRASNSSSSCLGLEKIKVRCRVAKVPRALSKMDRESCVRATSKKLVRALRLISGTKEPRQDFTRRTIREGEELTVDYRTYGADALLPLPKATGQVA